MSADTMTVVAAGLLFDKRGLLICQRSPAGQFPNKWEFPGGKIEAGEDPKEALRRELEEELGIIAEVGKEVWRTEHQYAGHPPVRLLFFAVPRYSHSLQNRVFQQVVWTPLSALRQFDFLDADRPLIEKLASGEIQIERS